MKLKLYPSFNFIKTALTVCFQSRTMKLTIQNVHVNIMRMTIQSQHGRESIKHKYNTKKDASSGVIGSNYQKYYASHSANFKADMLVRRTSYYSWQVWQL